MDLTNSLPSPSGSTPAPLRLYTPFEVRIAAFLGGPFAAVYTLHYNFRQLRDAEGKKLTLIGGAVFIVLLLAIIPFLPDKFPRYLLPLFYSWGAGGISSSTQISKEQFISSSKFLACSGWNVTLVSLISLIGFCLVAFPVWLSLDYFGIIKMA